MRITTSIDFPVWGKVIVDHAVIEAKRFIGFKHPKVDIQEVPVDFSTTRKKSVFYFPFKDKPARINIAVNSRLVLYNKKSVGLTTPPDGLLIGMKMNTTLSLIHELTHFIQHVQGRKGSEVETTLNEIEYLKLTDMFWYNQLIPSY